MTLRASELATLMGLEPTTSYVTGMFGLISLLCVDVCRCPSLLGVASSVRSADVRRGLPISAPYATLMLHLKSESRNARIAFKRCT